MPAVTTVATTGNASIDGLLGGVKWATSTLTYSFPTSGSLYGSGYAEGENTASFGAMSATQQSAVTAALGTYAAVANLRFTALSETATQHADLRFALSDAPATAWAYFPSASAEGGDVWFNRSSGDYARPEKGNYAYLTFLHEIGHALGLEHAHESGMPGAFDAMAHTVMSYRSYEGASVTRGYVNESGGYAQSPMAGDIAALQHLYGANFATQAGDTVYRWSASTGEAYVNGVGQGAPVANRIFQTVWDGGGTDTYDFSNYSNDLNISLRPGSASVLSQAQLAYLGDGRYAQGNVFNALLHNNDPRSLIENAVAGSGNNKMTGNQADNRLSGGGGSDQLYGRAGNDTLIGGDGNDVVSGMAGTDTLWGGAGSDAFVFDTAPDAANVDVIRDFSVPGDTIRLDNAVFAGLGAEGTLAAGALAIGSAADAGDRIIYNATTGFLSYDSDGTGAQAAVRFAQVTAGLALSHADFLVI